MAKSLEIVLNKKQIDFMVKASGEKGAKSAFRMFMRAMEKEKIRVDKMPLLIDKMMAKSSGDKKE